MQRLIFVVFTFLTTHFFFGQSNYQVNWYSADNNYLPQNSVKYIVEDKYGFIWLSTEDSLVRYDGENFKVYNTTNIKGLNSGRMVLFWGSVAKDSIYIKTENKEQILINKRRVAKVARKKQGFQFSIKKPFYILYEESVFGKHYSAKNEFFKILATNSYFIVGNDNIRQYESNNNLLPSKLLTIQQHLSFFQSGISYICWKVAIVM